MCETASVTETDEVSQFAPVTSPEGSERLVTHRGVPDSELLMAKKKSPRPAGEPTGWRPCAVVVILPFAWDWLGSQKPFAEIASHCYSDTDDEHRC